MKLQTLFAPIDQCHQAQVWLYGQFTTVYYQCFELHWESPKTPVLFVLTQLPNGKQLILLSSDLSLSGPEVIAAYGLRFKIEVTFPHAGSSVGGLCLSLLGEGDENRSHLADYSQLGRLPRIGSSPHPG